MRMTVRRTGDRHQLVFDWTTAAMPATTACVGTANKVEGKVTHGYERRDSTGGSPVLPGAAGPSGKSTPGGPPEPFGNGNTHGGFARHDAEGVAGTRGIGDPPEHATRRG